MGCMATMQGWTRSHLGWKTCMRGDNRFVNIYEKKLLKQSTIIQNCEVASTFLTNRCLYILISIMVNGISVIKGYT